MLVEDIMCPECGGNATLNQHKMDCSSKERMEIYMDFLYYLQTFPNPLLDKLKTLIYAEQMDRQMRNKRYSKGENDE